MVVLNESFLIEVGLDKMSKEQKDDFLDYLRETLETRVGSKLAQGLSESLLIDFEKLIDSQDEDGALQWLEKNCPNYKLVVDDETARLREEIMANKDQILALED